MKSFTKFLTCIALSCLFFSSNLFAQESSDPLKGQYSIAKSSEAFLFEIAENDGGTFRTFNFNRGNYSISQTKHHKYSHNKEWSCNDVLCIDMNGDEKDEIVRLMYEAPNTIRIDILDDQFQKLSNTIFINNCDTDEEYDQGTETTSLVAGNFDNDDNKEFALAFAGTDQKFHVQIYGLDSLQQLVLIAEDHSVEFETKVGHNAEYDYHKPRDPFDITASDFDADGTNIDEIVLVHGLDGWHSDAGDYKARDVIFDAVYYKIDGTTLNTTLSNNIKTSIDWGSGTGKTDWLYRIGRPSLACAQLDLDNSAQKEIVFGYVVSQYRSASPLRTGDYHTIQILNVQVDGEIKCHNYVKPKLVEYFYGNFYKGFYWRYHFSLNVECADFNDDQVDEIVVDGPRHLYLYSYSDNELTKIDSLYQNNTARYEARDRTFAIADVNVDTSVSTYTKEIVYIKRTKDIKDQADDNTGEIQLCVASMDVDYSTGTINGLDEKDVITIQQESYAKDHKLSYLLAMGDFDANDGLQMGEPKEYKNVNFPSQPTIILNAPPVHFDIIDGIPYDVNSAFNDNENLFWASYRKVTSETTEFTSTLLQDWSLSSHLTGKLKVCGTGIEATFKQKYGINFEKESGTSHSKKISQKMTASKEDLILYTNATFDLYEYPVIFNKDSIGSIMISVPVSFSQIKGSTDNWTGDEYIPNHEPGNILSYKNYSDVIENPDAVQAVELIGSTEIILDKSSIYDESYEFGTVNSDIFKLGFKAGFGISVLASAGYEGKGEGWSVEASAELGLEATYDISSMRSFKTELSEQEEFFVHFDKLSEGLGSTDYIVRPYMYQSKSGALVLDYAVKPIARATGYNDLTFWDVHYDNLPDPAFILPWRYEPAENLTDTTKRFQTREIIFLPSNPYPGDTVAILASIHNFSLKDLPQSHISIRYYIGDPDAGGQPITGLNGETEITKDTTLSARDEMNFSMDWIVPAGLKNHARLYAKIDPDDTIEEIHEYNNNKGWVYFGDMATSIDIDQRPVKPTKYSLKQNYPNPFNPSTQIQFTIPKTEMIKIEIFNLLGQKVKTLLHEKRDAGNHVVKFTATNFASGLYYYRIIAGEFINVKKMLLLK